MIKQDLLCKFYYKSFKCIENYKSYHKKNMAGYL